jgi:ribosomal protein L24E
MRITSRLGLIVLFLLGFISPLLMTSPAEALSGISVPDTNFGTVQYNTVATQDVTITNNTGGTVFIYDMSTNDGQFTLTGDPQGIASNSWCGDYQYGGGDYTPIANGDSCFIAVMFAPGALGARQGVLSVDFYNNYSPYTVGTVYGTATAQLSANVIDGSLQVPPVSFGSVHIGDTRAQDVQVTDNGPGDMSITGLSANDAQFTAGGYPSDVPSASQCGDQGAVNLQPGGTCSIWVAFTPSGSGSRSAVLTIDTEAGTFTTPLTGTGYEVGYWMLSADGTVYPFGDVTDLGHPHGDGAVQAVKLEPTPTGGGYWILTSDGAVTGYGDAAGFGNGPLGNLASGETATSMSSTPSGQGYWVFTNRGRVLPFGDAKFFGDMSKVALNGPILGSIATPSGNGYYMVASDGGIFAFGDAKFQGSMGGRHLNAAVEAIVPTADNGGYWLVASDGGIFAFADAQFRGSMGAARLNQPVAGMIRYGDGYLMVASDGGIFNFSDEAFLGSLGSNPPSSPVVSVGAVG